MSPKQRTVLIALGSVVGGILLVVSAVVVAKDLTKKPKATKVSANGSTTTTLALGPSDDSGTTTTAPGGVVITTPTTVTVPGGGGGGTVATTPTTQQRAVTTTTVVGPVAVSGTPVLQPASATLTANNIKACQGLTHYVYSPTATRPACGDVASGSDNNFHLFWVIEPAKPADDTTSSGSGTFVSVWGLNQPKGNGDSWQLKLQANFPSTQFTVKAPILSTLVPGSAQLVFGFDVASPQAVHVDVVQVIGSGPTAVVQVALHVDGNFANAGSNQLEVWTPQHQVIQFVKGAFRIQLTDSNPPQGATNL